MIIVIGSLPMTSKQRSKTIFKVSRELARTPTFSRLPTSMQPAESLGVLPVESNLVQSLTDTQLRASPVPVSFTRLASGTDSVTIVPSGTQTVSGTVTANIGTTKIGRAHV